MKQKIDSTTLVSNTDDNHLKINPTSISNNAFENKILYSFFSNNSNERKFWSIHESYPINDKEITFTQPIICHDSESKNNEPRFEVLNTFINKGARGRVFNLSGAMIQDHSTGSMYFKNKKPRVVKISSMKDQTKEKLEYEYNLMKLIGGFGVKKPVIENNYSYLIMRKLEGEELFDFIQRDRALQFNPPLTNEQRLTISINLLKALKKISDKGIIHQDIKSENIMIDANFNITIFDFDLSMMANEPCLKKVGTSGYYAPEILSYKPCLKSDVFSMARVIALLWRDANMSSYLSINYDPKDITYKLFQGLTIDTFHKNLIFRIIETMSRKNPEERLSVEEAIKAFEQIDFKSSSCKENTFFKFNPANTNSNTSVNLSS